MLEYRDYLKLRMRSVLVAKGIKYEKRRTVRKDGLYPRPKEYPCKECDFVAKGRFRIMVLHMKEEHNIEL
jgi:hypothetical protein